MDLNNPVVKLCLEGTRAEFEGRVDDARALYLKAWHIARDNYEACVAAHYVARCQENPEDTLSWNQVALTRADAAGGERVRDFYPSSTSIWGAHMRYLAPWLNPSATTNWQQT